MRELDPRFGDGMPWSAIEDVFNLLDTQVHVFGRARGNFRPRQMQRGVLSIKTTLPHSGGDGTRNGTGLIFQIGDLLAACKLRQAFGDILLREPKNTPYEPALLALCATLKEAKSH